jgi:hypothetical protein
MEYAAPMLATQPANGLTCGIDWARDDHAIAIVDGLGHQVYRGTGATQAAIERRDGPVVDTLLDAGITVVVISPNQLKNLRSRYGSAGTKTTASTRSCWPIRCAPTGPGCVRWSPTARPRRRCAQPAGPAEIWSPIGWRWPTSCASTSSACFPGRSGCSKTSIR